MSAPRRVPAVLTVLALCATALSFGVAPAGATGEEVTCTIPDASMSFSPGLKNRNTIEGRSNGRGPSTATLTATLTECTDPVGGPAPAGITHGVVSGTGKVAGSYCERLAHLKLKSDIQWIDAGGTTVGSTRVRLAITETTPFGEPPRYAFAGPGRGPRRTTLFRDTAISFSLDTFGDWMSQSAACFKLQLDGIGFQPGTLTAVDPAP